MKKKAIYKDLVDAETGEVKRIKWLAAESELIRKLRVKVPDICTTSAEQEEGRELKAV